MAANKHNYSCDYCFTSNLTYNDVNSIWVKCYEHNDSTSNHPFNTKEAHLCKKCYREFIKLPQLTMLQRLKDFLCRIRT